ncbi:MAG: TRAP transporter large permease [Clostridiales bacterium]|nr:TRAP transporter large permease [Clostridiales bacterium]
MSPLEIALITLGLLLLLLFSGVHLVTTLMTTSLVGVFLVTGRMTTAINVLSMSAWGSIRDYMFGVIPLFMLMGLFANLSGASKELYDSANLMLKKVRGGVGMATVVANAIFAAITGVSIASSAIFTKIALPQMLRLGYNRKVSVGCIAGSAVLGMLIPPSLLMIVYGSQADVSIGKLFLGGVLPGIVLSLAFCVTIALTAIVKPKYIPKPEPLTEDEKKNFWKIVLRPWAMLILIFVSLGGIWMGIFTPTEAGGVGAFGAFLIVILKGKFNWKTMKDTLLSAVSTSGAVLILLIAASCYSKTLSMAGVVNMFSSAILGLSLPPVVIILLFMVVLLLLGCILDSTSILLLTIPLMVPIVKSFGMDPVWFGIVMIVAVECGLLTPPFGMNVFTVKAAIVDMPEARGIRVEEIFSGSFPYFLTMIFVLLLMIFVPQIVL